MNGFSILMFIFGACTLLMGFYMYRGNKVIGLAWRAPYQHLDKNGWKNVGKWTMIVSIFIFILGIVGLFIVK